MARCAAPDAAARLAPSTRESAERRRSSGRRSPSRNCRAAELGLAAAAIRAARRCAENASPRRRGDTATATAASPRSSIARRAPIARARRARGRRGVAARSVARRRPSQRAAARRAVAAAARGARSGRATVYLPRSRRRFGPAVGNYIWTALLGLVASRERHAAAGAAPRAAKIAPTLRPLGAAAEPRRSSPRRAGARRPVQPGRSSSAALREVARLRTTAPGVRAVSCRGHPRRLAVDARG